MKAPMFVWLILAAIFGYLIQLHSTMEEQIKLDTMIVHTLEDINHRDSLGER